MKALFLLAALAPVAASAATFSFDAGVEALLYDGSNAATATHLDDFYQGLFLSYYRGTDANGNLDPYVPVTAVSYADYLLPTLSAPNAVDGFAGSLIVDLNPVVFPSAPPSGSTSWTRASATRTPR